MIVNSKIPTSDMTVEDNLNISHQQGKMEGQSTPLTKVLMEIGSRLLTETKDEVIDTPANQLINKLRSSKIFTYFNYLRACGDNLVDGRIEASYTSAFSLLNDVTLQDLYPLMNDLTGVCIGDVSRTVTINLNFNGSDYLHSSYKIPLSTLKVLGKLVELDLEFIKPETPIVITASGSTPLDCMISIKIGN